MLQFMLCAAEIGRDGNKDSSGQEVWRLMSAKTRCPIEVNADEGHWKVKFLLEEEEEARSDCVGWEGPKESLNVVFPRTIQNSHGSKKT